jgi:taurine dioxygenase
MAQPQTFSVRPLSTAIGAIIEGIDLSAPLSKTTIEEIGQALVTYHVIFFEKQELSPARQRDVAREFGELHIHPIFPNVPDVPEIIVFDNHEQNPPTNDNWHTDVTSIPVNMI